MIERMKGNTMTSFVSLLYLIPGWNVTIIIFINAAQVLNVGQGMGSPAANHIARLAPHSPSPHMLSPNLAAAQVNVHSSPTRTPQPAIPTPSPSLQSRQLVGNSGAAGY